MSSTRASTPAGSTVAAMWCQQTPGPSTSNHCNPSTAESEEEVKEEPGGVEGVEEVNSNKRRRYRKRRRKNICELKLKVISKK